MINLKKNKRILTIIIVFFIAVFLVGVYLPNSLDEKEPVPYSLQKGTGYEEIANELEDKGIIKSALFFEFYALISLKYSKLQAGSYDLSSSMPIVEIVEKFSLGDIIKNKITVIEGWTMQNLADYVECKNIYNKEDFTDATKIDFSKEFIFLRNRPRGSSLEGYIFPDTYYTAEDSTPEEFLKIALSNFDKKLSLDLRQEIARQNRSLFEVITMASMLEKEVKSFNDKKVVAGILWKRIEGGVPLQVDATVNYITGKRDARVSLKDSQIDSRYNTYKYYGLPLGPISNPGMDSILAAVFPEKTDYWYYLSADGTGHTVFSKTLEEHNTAIRKYFN